MAEWREGHEWFRRSEEMRATSGDPGFTVDDATPVVLERFRVIAGLRMPDAARSGHVMSCPWRAPGR
ncbi:hypothetical protein [Streptomyces indiaensis]|uniref:Uncharacterized protein n=1 Tax=Streptomyces indiaensis TaxID=284033 RepID=A0ABN3V109_9ACTN